MKSLIKNLLGIIIGILFISINTSFAQEDFYYQVDSSNNIYKDNTDIGKIVKGDAIESKKGSLNQIFGLLGLKSNTYNQGPKKAEYYIKLIINSVLGLVSFVAFILIIYAFYLMFFSGHDEGVAKARKMLIGIFVALTIMGLSWMIVNFIFYIYQNYILK